MVTTIIEIIVNCFQGYIFTHFAYELLGSRNKKSYFKTYGLIFAAILALSISLLNLVMVYEAFLSIIYVGIIMAYCLIFLDGSILKKSFASAIPILTALFFSALVAIAYSMILNQYAEEILSKWNAIHVSAVLMVQLLLYFTLKLICYLFASDKQLLGTRDWAIIGSVALLEILNIIVLFLIAMEDVSKKIRILLISDLMITLVINVIICWLTVIVGRKQYENQQLKIESIQNSYNKQFIENAKVEYEVIRKLRHDSMNIYSMLDDYIANEKYSEARAFLSEIYNIANNKKIFVNTSNIALNSIINAKLSIAKSLSINTSCMIEDMALSISDMDLCRLLSNMLDNAIQYLSSAESDNKELLLKIYSKNENTVFLVRNTLFSPVLDNNPDLNSNKREASDHGYGIKVIKEIAEKNSGSVHFYEEMGCFCCMVSI